MIIKTILAGSVAAALLSSTALAQTTDNAIVNAVVAELSAQGYNRFEFSNRMNRLKIEAYDESGRNIERVYSLDGILLREEIEADGLDIERVFDAEGNLVREEIEPSDDDDYDDDDDDDDDGDDD